MKSQGMTNDTIPDARGYLHPRTVEGLIEVAASWKMLAEDRDALSRGLMDERFETERALKAVILNIETVVQAEAVDPAVAAALAGVADALRLVLDKATSTATEGTDDER